MSERPTLFVDRSLGKRVGFALREAGATVELHDDHFAQTAPDSSWIPDVSAPRLGDPYQGQEHPQAGWGACRRTPGQGTRLHLERGGNMSGADMARILVEHLPEIEEISTSQAPPFVYVVGPGIFQQVLHVLPASSDP